MTHPKITMKSGLQPDAANEDFATLADRLIQDAWHLPPEGDQSWREQDARRIFSLDGKQDINDEPPAREEEVAPRDEVEEAFEPPSRPPGAIAVFLPLALATGIVVFTVAFSAPEILTPGFWAAPGAQPQLTAMPVSLARAAPVQTMDVTRDLRPSLADSGNTAVGAVRAAGNAGASKPAPQQRRHAASDASGQARQKTGAVVRTGSASSPRQSPPRAKLAATRLPPIGAAYFAGHAPAVAVNKAAAADWKLEAARWDEMAAKIRARREKYQKTGDIAAAAGNASEFP